MTTPPVTDRPEERLDWYRRRVDALERMLVCYRVGKRPSEKLFRELESTGKRIAPDGTWRESAALVSTPPVTTEPETRG